MRATIIYGAGDVRIENVPDARIKEPTDAIIRIVRASICGSDLWPYRGYGKFPENGLPIGHEALGIVEAIGADVHNTKVGDLVAMPFAYSDNTCVYCQEGIHTSCVHGGVFGNPDVGGAQAEALRIPQADGTLVALPADKDDALMASLLTLTDVMATGHHAAISARVAPGRITAVVGDGAVGLCGVIAARRLGAEQIILLGRHEARIALAKQFGATDIVRARDEEAVEQVRSLTGGYGVHAVLECVGTDQAMRTSLNITRPGGAIGRVGLPHDVTIPAASPTFYKNLTISGGPAPARAYFAELLPDVLEGKIEPGRVFDRVVSLNDVPDGYRAMDNRESIKVMIKPA